MQAQHKQSRETSGTLCSRQQQVCAGCHFDERHHVNPDELGMASIKALRMYISMSCSQNSFPMPL